MKLTRYSICIVPCLTLALSSQAQLFTALDWQFSTNAKTNVPTASVNPFGATATAAVLGANDTYFFGTASQEGLFGTLTGLWDINQGQLVLATDRYAWAPVDYSVRLTQFISGGFYPGTVQFSIAPNPGVSRTVVQQQTGNMVGFWVADTYSWSQVVAGTNTVGLKITPSPAPAGSGAMLLDRVEFTITGRLVDQVPEPASGAMMAAGLLAFWAHSRFRRKLSM